ncbi:MAG: XdhC family protein [Phycisphaerae bacterium]|nr:XdhC family protein [Phycisphaerae bacterium]
MMESMLAEIVRRCDAGERVALCVLVRTRGSTPQARGAKMLVMVDGKTIGTLGGGCVEAEVRTRALQQLTGNLSNANALMEFRLDQDYGWDDGLICGGIMDVHVRIMGRADAEPFRQLLGRIQSGLSGDLDLVYETGEGSAHYRETFGPPPRLLIAGAGHVGQALATIANGLDFDVTVIDDRSDMATAERFSSAKRIIGDIEQALRDQPINADTFIVIVTRGHKNDAQALAAVVASSARYIGMIGSKRKIKAILADLSASGVPTKQLERIHAPIGLDIGAVSPAEIAVSIAAELVAALRGRDGVDAKPMKIANTELKNWINR